MGGLVQFIILCQSTRVTEKLYCFCVFNSASISRTYFVLFMFQVSRCRNKFVIVQKQRESTRKYSLFSRKIFLLVDYCNQSSNFINIQSYTINRFNSFISSSWLKQNKFMHVNKLILFIFFQFETIHLINCCNGPRT